MLCKVFNNIYANVIIIEGWLPFSIRLPQGQGFEGDLNIWKEVWCSQEVHVGSGYHRLDPP